MRDGKLLNKHIVSSVGIIPRITHGERVGISDKTVSAVDSDVDGSRHDCIVVILLSGCCGFILCMTRNLETPDADGGMGISDKGETTIKQNPTFEEESVDDVQIRMSQV